MRCPHPDLISIAQCWESLMYPTLTQTGVNMTQTHTLSRTVHYSQEVRTAHMSSNRWTEKQVGSLLTVVPDSAFRRKCILMHPTSCGDLQGTGAEFSQSQKPIQVLRVTRPLHEAPRQAGSAGCQGPWGRELEGSMTQGSGFK